MGSIRARARCVAPAATVVAASAPAAASASPFDPSGVVKPISRPQLHLNANQSSNWFGYNQGALEQGGKLFNSISGDWTVPTAGPHTRGQAASSATWLGIEGGCVDAGCTVTDPSGLIQTGTRRVDRGDAVGDRERRRWDDVPAQPQRDPVRQRDRQRRAGRSEAG